MPFGYFGRKGKLAHRYPPPTTDTIIEPFAGSAAYSLHDDYWKRNVVLIENDDRVVRLWKWFINEATENDFLNLPDYNKGDRIVGSEPIMDAVRLGAASDNWKGKSTITSNMARDWNGYRRRMVNSIHKIKHWEISQGDYAIAPNIEATWFIDPPYQPIQRGYGRNPTNPTSLDYRQLGEWVKSRRGTIIVCESEGANWLPFKPLYSAQTISNTRTKEVIWLNSKRS